MKRTSARTILVALVVGVTVGYLLDVGLAAFGRTTITPPFSLPVTSIGVAGLVLILGIRVRRTVTGKASRPVHPLMASRTVALAKAATLAGALLTGLSAGFAYFDYTRPALPSGATLLAVAASVLTSVVLTVCGLVAESLCTLPPDDTHSRNGAVGA